MDLPAVELDKTRRIINLGAELSCAECRGVTQRGHHGFDKLENCPAFAKGFGGQAVANP